MVGTSALEPFHSQTEVPGLERSLLSFSLAPATPVAASMRSGVRREHATGTDASALAEGFGAGVSIPPVALPAGAPHAARGRQRAATLATMSAPRVPIRARAMPRGRMRQASPGLRSMRVPIMNGSAVECAAGRESVPRYALGVGHLQVSDVGFVLGDGRRLLRDVSFKVGSGERVALIGPNGTGKTTLTRVVTGDVAPSEGS